jgi:hypothetical protein
MASRKKLLTRVSIADDFVVINPGEEYKVGEGISIVRLTAEWSSIPGSICDLDLNVFCYDDKGRFLEKLDFTHNVSKDGSAVLIADEGANDANTSKDDVSS